MTEDRHTDLIAQLVTDLKRFTDVHATGSLRIGIDEAKLIVEALSTQERGEGEGEFRPEFLADPRNDHPDERNANGEERLKLAYVIQQKSVPDQMAMVWRRDLGDQRHRLLRKSALVDIYYQERERSEFLLALALAALSTPPVLQAKKTMTLNLTEDEMASLEKLIEGAPERRLEWLGISREWFERKAALEGDLEVGAGYSVADGPTPLQEGEPAAWPKALERLRKAVEVQDEANALPSPPATAEMLRAANNEVDAAARAVTALYAAPVQPSPDREALQAAVATVLDGWHDGMRIAKARDIATAILTLLGQETGSARAGSDAHTVRPAPLHSDGGEG